MNKYTFTCSDWASCPKHFFHKTLLAFLFLVTTSGVWGQSAGFNSSFIVLSLNGGANTFYDLQAATANTDFNGANLGSFAAGTNNLVFKGAEHNVWRCASADLTSTRIYYRIYLTSAGNSGVSFISNNIGFNSGGNNGCGGQDQQWRNLNYTTNLLSGLAPGNYSIQVYSDATVTNCCGGTVFASNSGNNFTATFTVTGNYYSKPTGNLELTSSWGTNTDGSGNAPSNFTTPGNTFNIRNNATPTIGANWTVSGTGSKIIVGEGTNACNFTVPSNFVVTSPATEVSNNGTITRTTTGGNSWGTLTFASGARYVHNVNGGTLPTATWNANSTLQIDQSINGNQFTQNFGHVIINGSSTFFMRTEGFTSSIQGNFTHNGSASVAMSNSTSNGTFTIGGDLNITGTGTLRIQESAATSLTRNHTLIVNGNYVQSGGILNLSNETDATATNGCIANLQVKGNFTHTGGTISETAASANVVTRISLSGTSGTQTLESTGQTGTVNFNVAGSNAQCVVSATKTFVLGSGGMTVANGSSLIDLLVDGTLRSASTITTTGAITFSSTGTYEHNFTTTAGTIPTATWSAGSTCAIIGYTSGTYTFGASFGQSFSNFIWNCPNQTGNINIVANLTTVNGNFTLNSTGSGTLRYNGNSPATPILTVGGDFVMLGGTLDMSSGTSTPTFNISGNFNQAGGIITESNSGAGIFSFVKSSGIQTFTQSAGTISNTINWNIGNGTTTNTVQLGSNVNLGMGTGTFTVLGNATFDAGTFVLSGSAASTLNSGATVITANASGVNGSIALSGTRTYNAATNYTYNGTSAQVTGAAVTSANNLTLNNSAGLTLSAGTAVNGTLTLTNGKLTLGTVDLTLGGSASVSGASSTTYLVTNSTGQLKKESLTNAFSFPVGNSAYNPISISNSGTSDTYGVNVTDGVVADATVSSDCVNRRWFITEGTSGGGDLSVTPQYNTGETGASFSSGSQVYVGLYVPTTWTKTAATVSGSNPFTASASGFNQSLTSTSYFAIGNEGIYITAPTVTTTVAASAITNASASSGGQTITGINIAEKGVVWNTSTAPTVALTTKTNDGTGSADFISSLTSLSPQTLYYIRAFATNAAGTGYGDEKTLRTLSNPATAQASSLSATATSSSNIDLSWNAATFPSSGATAKGYVLLRANAPNTPALGNANGSGPTAGANTTIVSSTIGEGDVSFSNSGLASSTQYNYLLVPYTWDGSNASTYNYLTNSAPSASATTTSGATPPVLTTSAATSVTAVSATLNGDITSDGGGSVTTRGFVYSSSDNTPTIGEGGVTDQASGSGTGSYNFSVSSLSPNTTYYYQAYATNASGTSYGGVVSFITPKAEPTAQPTSLVFSSITTSEFSTAFTAATGSPDGYLVIRSTSSNLSANPVDGTTYTAGNTLGGGTIVSVGSTISGISNTGLSTGTTYYTFVFAFNNSGTTIDYLTSSPLSGSVITLTDAPAIPTLSSVTTSGFTVDWTATAGAISYRLDVSIASNFASFVSGYQDLTVNGTSQVVTGLEANTLYYVRVRAVNPSGTSANSGTANSATLPNAPTVGNATSITTSGLTANWTAPSAQGGVSFTYTIELSTANDFSTITSSVSNIASGTTSNAFTGLSEGTTYFYRVRAVNSAGNGTWSTVSAGATTLTSYVSLTALGTAETQNFDGMLSSTSLPSGWRMHASNSTPSWSSAATTLTQQASSGTPSTGGTYNWGTSATERAVGAMTSGGFPSPNQLLVYTKNNTGSIITNFSIAYTAERYRVNSAAASVKFYYSTNGSSWTEVSDGEIVSSNFPAGTSSYTFSTPLEIERTFIISGLSIASNADFYLRWDINTTGSNSQGIGIDDFSIKPCGTVSAPTASNQAFCSAAAPTVANLTATGTAVQWYAASTGGTALTSATSLNSTTYYATQTISGCESVSRTPVVVAVNTNPSAPTGSATQVQCSGATVSNLSATGSSIQWYAAPTGGSPLATNTAIVNGTTYYASQTTNSCESTTRLAVTPTIVNSGSWIGAASSDWSDAANWCGGVPTSSTSVTIPSGTPFPLVISASVSVNAMTINTGATVSTTGTPTITIANNGSFTNNGAFTAGTSKVSFAGAGTVSGTVGFNDVDIAGGVNFGSASTINGILTINTNGFVNANAPSYGNASKLRYNTGGTYGRGFEWGTTSGVGYPNDVQISNNTTLNYPNSAGNFSATIGVARDVTIDAGSSLYMDFGSGSASGALYIGRHINIAGDLSLGDAVGGDIYLGGDWTRTSGNFNANNRAVFFTGTTGNQTITNAAGESFPFMLVDKASGNVILNNNVTITGGLTLTSGLVDIGSNNFDLSSSTLAGGSPTSYVRTSGAGECRRNLPVGTTVLFPVGRSTYNPVELVKSVSQHKFGVRVLDVVTSNGQDNGPVSTGPNVGRMWDITPEAGYTASNGAVSVNLIYANNLGYFMNNFVNSSPADRRMFHFGPAWVDITDLTGQFDSGDYGIANYNYCKQPGITDFSPFTITNFAAVLPIELVSFQANCKDDNSVSVTWTTASEHNTSHYVVEKSLDGINWSELGQTAAAGNSTQLLNYELIDSQKASGTTYYRLTQFDNDGVFEVFNPVSINCNGATSNNHITTYPNPSLEGFYVSLFTETMEGNGQLTITDASGRPVYSKSVNIQDGNNVFHIRDLNAAPGMYYIQVSNGTTTTHIVKHSLR